MITLADAAKNTLPDIDLMVIDEFRKSSAILDALTFDQAVNPAGGGATLTYGYTRHVHERPAHFRAYNTEYRKAEATRKRYEVDLFPLGGAFDIDRILADLGPAATNEVSYQISQLIKATRAKFSNEFINGVYVETADELEPRGFDGIDKAVSGTVTERTASTRWGDLSDADQAHDALDELDEWLDTLDALPTMLLGNDKGIARLRSLARRAGYYERTRNEFGFEVESYRGIPLVNPRERDGSAEPIIGTDETGWTSLYAVRFGLDGVHGVTTTGGELVRTWLPDFTTAGAVKTGEVEMGPVAVVVKRTRSAGALRINVAPYEPNRRPQRVTIAGAEGSVPVEVTGQPVEVVDHTPPTPKTTRKQ
ncbi:major capsid protein [Saccharopolyspora shandongensis]|uniref:major capsid protein n=1 Tax=Saccharopolyspora shandongensis TaxID=418495 RepID=UPI0033EFEB60